VEKELGLYYKTKILKLVLGLFTNLEIQQLQNGWSQSSKILCESSPREELIRIKILAKSDKRFATRNFNLGILLLENY